MSDKKISFPKEDIHELFVGEFKGRTDLVLLNLSTLDGFLLHQVGQSGFSAEGDKVSAISSSLCSMSNSAVKELFSASHGVINIECDSGKVILFHLSLGRQKEGVLTLCCTQKMALAEGRFLAKRLTQNIEALFKNAEG